MIVYVLQCENDKYYVGKTDDLNMRVKNHKEGKTWWTKMHPMIKVEKVIENADEFDEDKYVKIYMKMYGIENVRGGSYSQSIISKAKLKILKSEMNSADNKCFKCGEIGHFMKKCPNKIKKDIVCNICNIPGHYANRCNKMIKELSEKILCYKCNNLGHYANRCKKQNLKNDK